MRRAAPGPSLAMVPAVPLLLQGCFRGRPAEQLKQPFPKRQDHRLMVAMIVLGSISKYLEKKIGVGQFSSVSLVAIL